MSVFFTLRQALISSTTILGVFLTLYMNANYRALEPLHQTSSALSAPLNLPQGQFPHQPRRFTLLPITVDSGYFFNLPILALAWRRLEIEPIFLIVHSRHLKLKSSNNRTIEYLEELGCRLVFIRSVPLYEATTSRLVIGLAAAIGDDLIGEEDFVMTSRPSLYPVGFEYFNRKRGDDIVAWECSDEEFSHDLKNYSRLGEVGMKKWQWREVMKFGGNEYGLNREELVLKLLTNFKETIQAGQYQGMDEKILSINIQRYAQQENKTGLVKVRRDFDLEKRISLLDADNLNGVVDVVAADGDVAAFEMWYLLERFFSLVFTPEECEFLHRYFKNYF